MIQQEQITRATQMLKAISHPMRLQVLDLLCRESELTVGQIHDALGCEQAVISQHLKVMRDQDVIATTKVGTRVFYRVAHVNFTKLLDAISKCHTPSELE